MRLFNDDEAVLDVQLSQPTPRPSLLESFGSGYDEGAYLESQYGSAEIFRDLLTNNLDAYHEESGSGAGWFDLDRVAVRDMPLNIIGAYMDHQQALRENPNAQPGAFADIAYSGSFELLDRNKALLDEYLAEKGDGTAVRSFAGIEEDVRLRGDNMQETARAYSENEGFWGGAARFAGGMAGGQNPTTNPIDFMTNFLGFGGGSVLKAAGKEALLSGGTTLGTEFTVRDDNRTRFGLDPLTTEQKFANVAAATVFGGALPVVTYAGGKLLNAAAAKADPTKGLSADLQSALSQAALVEATPSRTVSEQIAKETERQAAATLHNTPYSNTPQGAEMHREKIIDAAVALYTPTKDALRNPDPNIGPVVNPRIDAVTSEVETPPAKITATVRKEHPVLMQQYGALQTRRDFILDTLNEVNLAARQKEITKGLAEIDAATAKLREAAKMQQGRRFEQTQRDLRNLAQERKLLEESKPAALEDMDPNLRFELDELDNSIGKIQRRLQNPGMKPEKRKALENKLARQQRHRDDLEDSQFWVDTPDTRRLRDDLRRLDRQIREIAPQVRQAVDGVKQRTAAEAAAKSGKAAAAQAASLRQRLEADLRKGRYPDAATPAARADAEPLTGDRLDEAVESVSADADEITAGAAEMVNTRVDDETDMFDFGGNVGKVDLDHVVDVDMPDGSTKQMTLRDVVEMNKDEDDALQAVMSCGAPTP